MVDAQEEGSPLLEEPSLASRLVNLETQRLMGQSVFLQWNNFIWAVDIVKLFSVYHYKRFGIWIFLKPAYVWISWVPIFFILNLFSLGWLLTNCTHIMIWKYGFIIWWFYQCWPVIELWVGFFFLIFCWEGYQYLRGNNCWSLNDWLITIDCLVAYLLTIHM